MIFINLRIFVISILLSTCTDSCLDGADSGMFTIGYNKSNNRVLLVTHGSNESIFEDHMKFDSSYISEMPVELVDVKSSVRIDDWKDLFSYYNSKTMVLSFFDIDTIQKYGWDKVRTDYKILARYDLTMENIIDLGGIVPYPLQDSTVKIYYPEGLNPFED